MELCSKKKSMPVGDPLHLFKNIRSRYINHPIKLFYKGNSTNYCNAKDVLKLGNALDDKSQIGTMRDVYVIQLFSFTNVSILLKVKLYNDGFLFFIFSCWIAVIFSSEISLEFRLFLTELCFQCLSICRNEFELLKTENIAQKQEMA